VKLSRGILLLFAVILIAPHLFAKTWYVRPDGGTRYSSNVPTGQCDGKADVAYPGSGVNRHCAFNDFRYMWDDKSGRVGAGAWIIAGGDTVLIRGCSAGPGQSNPDNPHCRLGWDAPTGNPPNTWCYGVGSYTCFNPAIPAGTAAQHTRILGQNFAACNAGGATNPKAYVSNLTQLFGGFSQQYTFNLENTKYVDIQCIELTNHNNQCTHGVSPGFPRPCNTNQPLDDYADNGFITNNASANITFEDVYVHGFAGSGLKGPIGGPVTMTRVNSSFNAHAGWDFDDGHNTADAAGSSIIAKYVTMIGNGCYEEYPVKHAFSARACFDDTSGGFGDAWSGQDTDLDTFVCDHCEMAYNTKDAFIGPHTNLRTLTITNSQSYGNMGAQWKWNNTPGATVTFENNLTVGNCLRMSAPVPGASQSFAVSTKLPGAYLSDYCRAGGNTVAVNTQENSHVLFANNTFVDYLDTVILMSCGPANGNHSGKCGSTPVVFTNNIFLGYYIKGNEPPALFFMDDRSLKVTSSHNIEFGNRSEYGDSCRGDIICSDPRLVNQPPQQAWTNQTFLDNFTFYPRSDSPAIGSGAPINGLATDFYGSARPNPPSIGAVEPHRAQ
jgi:hypothetical protein